MATVKIKSDDTSIQFDSTLTINSVAADITGATVLFLLKLKSAPYTSFSASATIVSAVAGTVKYVPSGGFPTAIGVYKQEWQVTYGDGTILTFPSDNYNTVIILEDLN